MKQLYTAIICFFCNIVFLFGQSDSLPSKEIVKTNWNIGGIPVGAYNSDLGLQYGIIVNPFYYGDGSTYPNYLHKLYFEVSRYTKGSGIYRFYYNSKYIIPGVNTFFDLSYLTDEAYDFLDSTEDKANSMLHGFKKEMTVMQADIFMTPNEKCFG